MKTILITGSTDGIGKLTATKLAIDGHHIILHGRNNKKLQNTLANIKDSSANPKIEACVSDLSDFQSIEQMYRELAQKLPKIDVLINNAGVFNSSIDRNKDELDLRFAVNYFAPYILTKGVLPLLQKSISPRVINLSSAAQATVALKALKGEVTLSAQEAYAQSKLALTMWSFYLAKKLTSLNIIAVNPGSLLNTKMVQEAYGQYWSSADKGANILYDLAVLEEYNESSGKYFDNDKGVFAKAHKDAYDSQKITMLIAETDKIING